MADNKTGSVCRFDPLRLTCSSLATGYHMFTDCTETVSILHAIVFGADGACVEISIGSILAALTAFTVLVVIAQFFARKLWAKLLRPNIPDTTQHAMPEEDHPFSDDPNYRDSAIRPSKR